MNEYANYLFTVYYPANGYSPLLKCAVKIKRDIVHQEVTCADMVANSEYWSQFLPPHVASCGPIVACEEIFEIA